MYSAMYLHCWDVVEEGVEKVLSTIAEAGVEAVNLATSYHGGRFILPHNPNRRVYFAEDGVIYFKPNPENYVKTKLKPKRSERFKDVDVLELTIEASSRLGLKVNSWTICFHNSYLVNLHPEVAIIDLFGTVDQNWMCPNNPDARNYVLGLIKDLASNYELNYIQLESIGFPWGMIHGDHHENIGAFIEPFMSYLYSSCFCKHCMSKAREHGLDLEHVRSVVKDLIDESLSTPINVSANTPMKELLINMFDVSTEFRELLDLIWFRHAVVEEVCREARDVVREVNPKIKLSVITGCNSRGFEGVSLSKLRKVIDAVDYLTYFDSPEPIYMYVKWAKRIAGEMKIIAGIRTCFPAAYSPNLIISEVEAAREAGADGVGFYNYGWTPLNYFKAIKTALKKSR